MADEEDDKKEEGGVDPEMLRALADAAVGKGEDEEEKPKPKDEKVSEAKVSELADKLADKMATKIDEMQSKRHQNDGWTGDESQQAQFDGSDEDKRQRRRLIAAFRQLIDGRKKDAEPLDEKALRALQDAFASIGLGVSIDKKSKSNPAVVVNLPKGQLVVDKVGIYASRTPTDDELKATVDLIAAMPKVWEGHWTVDLSLGDETLYKLWSRGVGKSPPLTIDNLTNEMRQRFRERRNDEQAQALSSATRKSAKAEGSAVGGRVARRRPLLPPKRDNIVLEDYIKGLRQNTQGRNAHMAHVAGHHETAIDALRLAMADAARMADAHKRQLAIVAAGAAFIAAQRAFRTKGTVADAPVQGIKLKGPTAQERTDTVLEHLGLVTQRQERAAKYYHAMAARFARSVGTLSHSTDPAADSLRVQKAFDQLTAQHTAFVDEATKSIKAKRDGEAERLGPFVEGLKAADPSRADTSKRGRGFGRGLGR